MTRPMPIHTLMCADVQLRKDELSARNVAFASDIQIEMFTIELVNMRRWPVKGLN